MSPTPVVAMPTNTMDGKMNTSAPGDATLDAAIGLVEKATADEERFLGLALALHHSEELSCHASLRTRLHEALASDFLARLVHSKIAFRRVGLAALRVLACDEAGAIKYHSCAQPLVDSCTALRESSPQETETVAGGNLEPHHACDELLETIEILRQFIHFVPSFETLLDLAPAFRALFDLFSPTSGALFEVVRGDVGVAEALMNLLQEYIAAYPAVPSSVLTATSALVEAMCLEPLFAGTTVQSLALALLAEQVEARIGTVERIDEALGHALAVGDTGSAASLRLAAACLGQHGLSFGLRSNDLLFSRLKPLLSMATGEVRLGLEGHTSLDRLCAACMLLEAAIVALGNESDAIEAGGHLQDASDCLRHLHRAVGDIHDYCADLASVPNAGSIEAPKPPAELAVLARVAAAWHLEDSRQFSVEFERSLRVFCRISCQEFRFLLPAVQQVHDWHLTPTLGKILEITLESFSGNDGCSAASSWGGATELREVQRQCAMMLAETALDAAAYLPDGPVPEAPTKRRAIQASLHSCDGKESAQVFVAIPQQQQQMPRPLQADDPEHEGVLRLSSWSRAIWAEGLHDDIQGPAKWELGIVCCALLISVPEVTVSRVASMEPALPSSTRIPLDCSLSARSWPHGAWAAVADCLFSGPKVEASLWRLAMRLAGFALDRHYGMAHALGERAVTNGPKLCPPKGAEPGLDEDEDEWAVADKAASMAIRNWLRAAATSPRRPCETPRMQAAVPTARVLSASGQPSQCEDMGAHTDAASSHVPMVMAGAFDEMD